MSTTISNTLPGSSPGKLLRIHVSEGDTHKGMPLHEAIVAKCREMGISGATVFPGLEGYGESAEMHKAHVVRNDRPLVITIVDSAERLAALAPVVEAMIDTGMTALSDVQVVRVQKKKRTAT
jgi:PII-like signaling protein